jgi:Na+/proline symporter
VSFAALGLLALGGYLVFLVVVGEYAHRARVDQSPADHFLASRHLGTFVLLLTLYATAYSGNSLLGYPGEAYRRGFSWIMATGFMMSIIVVFHALVPGLRPIAVREGFVTPGDWVRHRFAGEASERSLRIVIGALMVLALANFLLAQLVAMGHVAHEVTGGTIPFAVGVAGLAAVILFYETRGGMRAVAWTDAAQGVLMLFGLMALLGWLLAEAGGIEATTRRIAELRPEAVAIPDSVELANWASTIVLLGLASVLYPQAIQRVYAARSAASLRRALALMSFMPLTTTLVVTLIGLAAITHFEGLATLEADTVMPRLLGAWAEQGAFAQGMAVVVFIGALAAIMSTADSVLLSLGSLIAVDLFDRPRGAAATTSFGKRAAAAVMVGAALVALAPRLTLWRLIELKMELLIQCVPAFLLALHWRRLGAAGCLAGALVGTALSAGGTLLGIKRLGGVHVGVIGLAVNLGVAVVWSWLRPAPHSGAGCPSASAR